MAPVPFIDPQALKPWLGALMVLEPIDGGVDFRYRLVGTQIVDLVGYDITGSTVLALQQRLRLPADLAAEYRVSLVERCATYDEQTLLTVVDRFARYRLARLVLPCADAAGVVQRLLVHFEAWTVRPWAGATRP